MKQVNETIMYRLQSLATMIFAEAVKEELGLKEGQAIKRVLEEFGLLFNEYLDWYCKFKEVKEKEPYLSFEDFRLQNDRVDDLMGEINDLVNGVFYEEDQ